VDACRTGNRSPVEVAKGLTFLVYAYGTRAGSRRAGAPARWLYNRMRGLWGGVEFPRRPDLLPDRRAAPRQNPGQNLGLRPGDMVRILTAKFSPRWIKTQPGLMFDAEMVPQCEVFRVKRFVERFVNEANGR
jgi:hypothetical protein